jgi:GAF domain-containing protein
MYFLDDSTRYATLMSHRLTRRIVGDAKSVELVQAAARRFTVPLASIGLVGRTNVHLVAETGSELHVVPRALSFSTHALASDAPVIVEDALRDRRFANHPTVIKRQLRFIAIAPLIEHSGQRLGGFCLLDHRPHTMSQEDIADLVRFASAAMARIDFLSVVSELAHSVAMPRRQGLAAAVDEPVW